MPKGKLSRNYDSPNQELPLSIYRYADKVPLFSKR